MNFSSSIRMMILVAILINLSLIALIIMDYFLFEKMLEINSNIVYVSHFISNYSYNSLIAQYACCSNACNRRFFFVNTVLKKSLSSLSPSEENEVKGNSKIEGRNTPTVTIIDFDEIIAMYGKGTGLKVKDEKKILKSLIPKNMESDRGGLWDRFVRRWEV